tara:strand:+ start:26003 stop:27100 length:1098 start_codon:yes stop_codon:yes gene_type:complete
MTVRILIKEAAENIPCDGGHISIGVIPPNLPAMTLDQAGEHYGLGEIWGGHAGFVNAYEKKFLKSTDVDIIGRAIGFSDQVREGPDYEEWIFITSSENYYTYKNPEDWNDATWHNAVTEIAKIRKKCGEPNQLHGLSFETAKIGSRLPEPGMLVMSLIKKNSLFISGLINKKAPVISKMSQFRESRQGRARGPRPHCNPGSTGAGIIGPGQEYMSIPAAASHYGLNELESPWGGPIRVTSHVGFRSAYLKKYKKPAALGFVFVTNVLNYYSYVHPEDWDDDEWTNAVDQISKTIDSCESQMAPNAHFYFDVTPYLNPKMFNLKAIHPKKKFLSLLMNKREPPKKSMLSLFRERKKKSIKLIILNG